MHLTHIARRKALVALERGKIVTPEWNSCLRVLVDVTLNLVLS